MLIDDIVMSGKQSKKNRVARHSPLDRMLFQPTFPRAKLKSVES